MAHAKAYRPTTRNPWHLVCFVDFIVGLFCIAAGITFACMLSQDIWHGCVWLSRNVFWLIQPVGYYLSLIAFLSILIAACYAISLGCMIIRQGWDGLHT